MKGVQYFAIDGYWKDDKSTFEGYLVKSTDAVGEHDEDIFFFGLTEVLINDAINRGEDTVHDFVITGYRKIR